MVPSTNPLLDLEKKRGEFSFWVLVALGSIVCLTLRLLAVFNIPPLFDEMVQIYMARDIAHLSRFPLYFDGQAYMGPLESYFLAPLLRWFGFSFIKARIFNELFYFAFTVIYCRLMRRLFDRQLTLYAFLLLCFLPFTPLFFTTVVGYGEILALAALSLVLLVKIFTPGTERGWTEAFVLGFISGLAFWCNPIFVVWLIPLGLILMTIPEKGKAALVSLFSLGFLAGLFPAWVHAYQTKASPMVLEGAGYRFAAIKDTPYFFFLFFSRMKFFLTTAFLDSSPSILKKFVAATSFVPLTLFAFSFCTLLFYLFLNWRGQIPIRRAFFIFLILPCFILTFLYSLRDLRVDEGIRFFLPLVMTYVFCLAWWIRSFRSLLGNDSFYFHSPPFCSSIPFIH